MSGTRPKDGRGRPSGAGVLPERVAVIGTGVIGAGWACHFLRMGLDVVAWDPAPDSSKRLADFVRMVWPTIEGIGLRPGASADRLVCASSPEEAVASADFVQESSTEDLAAKVALFERLDAAVPAPTIIASSTSGLKMTDIQARCQNPERTVVGHPYNPPYLLPLVEVVAGRNTSSEALESAVAFYEAVEKRPLVVRSETPGFVANRLQEAVWREMLHMIAAGEATVEEADAAMVDGPGLRWAVMGPAMTFHIGGGQGGMGAMLDHFAHVFEEPWTRLGAPPMSDKLRAELIDGCLREAAGRSYEELVRMRDLTIAAVLQARSSVEGAERRKGP